MKELKFNVKGMMCNACENRVKNAVGDIEGIESVEADHTKGKVTVTCNDSIESKIVEETIEDIGFEVVR